MVWNSWSEFFAMGGYGLYVWGAIGACLLLPALELLGLRLRRKAALAAAALENEVGERDENPA